MPKRENTLLQPTQLHESIPMIYISPKRFTLLRRRTHSKRSLIRTFHLVEMPLTDQWFVC